MYAAAAAEGLTPEQCMKRLQDIPIPEGGLTPAEVNAELELVRVGQRRKTARPAKPSNSNDAVVALLREHRPDDFNGRFTLARRPRVPGRLSCAEFTHPGTSSENRAADLRAVGVAEELIDARGCVGVSPRVRTFTVYDTDSGVSLICLPAGSP